MRFRPLALLLLATVLLAVSARAGEPLSVFGVMPGMTAKQVEGLLGKPLVERQSPKAWCYRKGVQGLDDPTVFFGTDGKVSFVAGSQVTRGDKVLLKRGARVDEMQTVLGSPSSTRNDGGATVYVFAEHQLSAVAGGPAKLVMVFGLGQEPGR